MCERAEAISESSATFQPVFYLIYVAKNSKAYSLCSSTALHLLNYLSKPFLAQNNKAQGVHLV